MLLLGAVMAAAAATLLDQPDAFNAHAALYGFHHVVDVQARDRDRGQRLHLDAGWSGNLDLRPDIDAGGFVWD